MSRYGAPQTVQYSFGPGGISPAVAAILILCVAGFLLTAIAPAMLELLGLVPQDVVTRFFVWQPLTYIFIHADAMHLLFNMLGIWMFGVELERHPTWGTRRFARFFLICGVAAGLATVAAGVLPIDSDWRRDTYRSVTVGASGAFYGLAYAWSRVFPYRTVLIFLIFPVKARWFALILIGIDLAIAVAGSGSNVAHLAHLAGFAAAAVMMNSGPGRPGGLGSELKYRYLRWKMNRLRKRFDVVEGGRNKDRWVH